MMDTETVTKGKSKVTIHKSRESNAEDEIIVQEVSGLV